MNRKSIVVSSIATVIMHHSKQCVCVCVCVYVCACERAHLYMCLCVCMFSKCMLVYASVGPRVSDNVCAYTCPYECVNMARVVGKLFRITFNTCVEEKSSTWAEKSATWILFSVRCSDRPRWQFWPEYFSVCPVRRELFFFYLHEKHVGVGWIWKLCTWTRFIHPTTYPIMLSALQVSRLSNPETSVSSASPYRTAMNSDCCTEICLTVFNRFGCFNFPSMVFLCYWRRFCELLSQF